MFLSDDDRLHLKVCGITDLAQARYVSGALVDFIGFIFVKESPRYIDPAEAGAIVTWLEGPKCVGVFRDQPLEEVQRIVKETGVTVAQLHGNESVEFCQKLSCEVIKTFSIEETTTRDDLLEQIEPYRGAVDYFLFDTKIGDQAGGTGKHFDWSLIEEIDDEIPVIIAGGISIEDVETIMEQARPFAIDVNSSLESAPGVKDLDKMEDFFERFEQLKYYQ